MSDTCSDGAARLPDNHEDFGVIHDPHPVEDGLPVLEDLDVEITKHICRVDGGEPLCEGAADDGAPIYPFRGMRSQIIAGLNDCCPDCRDRLAAIAADEVDGLPVATDGGSDTCADETEHSPPEGFPPCPGCGGVGFSVQQWVGEDQVQMWQCDDDTCRVEQYRPRDCDPQENPGGELL